MNEEMEIVEQEDEDKLTCPACGEWFQDMRGLTSHARHKHDISLKELRRTKNSQNDNWKVLGSIGAFLFAIFFAGKFR